MRGTVACLVTMLCLPTACGGATPAAEAPPTPATTTAPAPSAAPADTAPTEPGTDSSDTSTSTGGGGCPDDMVKVEGGTLWMGSPDGQGRPDEHPQHKVELLAYCMDKHEVTVGDYAQCVKNAICDPVPKEVQLLKAQKNEAHDKLSALCTGGLKDNTLMPLNCVDYDLAQKYCDWKGRRLPTESEWEFAATGGDDKLAFPWGNDPPTANNMCWKQKAPCKIESVTPGAFGISDLEGSLSEWTSTPYGPYPTPPESDSATAMTVRGASWKASKVEDVAPQRRASRQPLYADVTIGFRCAKSY